MSLHTKLTDLHSTELEGLMLHKQKDSRVCGKAGTSTTSVIMHPSKMNDYLQVGAIENITDF